MTSRLRVERIGEPIEVTPNVPPVAVTLRATVDSVGSPPMSDSDGCRAWHAIARVATCGSLRCLDVPIVRTAVDCGLVVPPDVLIAPLDVPIAPPEVPNAPPEVPIVRTAVDCGLVEPPEVLIAPPDVPNAPPEVPNARTAVDCGLVVPPDVPNASPDVVIRRAVQSGYLRARLLPRVVQPVPALGSRHPLGALTVGLPFDQDVPLAFVIARPRRHPRFAAPLPRSLGVLHDSDLLNHSNPLIPPD